MQTQTKPGASDDFQDAATVKSRPPPAEPSRTISNTLSRRIGRKRYCLIAILAPVVGPAVGGYLTDQYSWHWIFLINVPIGLAAFFGVLQLVQKGKDEDQDKQEPHRRSTTSA